MAIMPRARRTHIRLCRYPIIGLRIAQFTNTTLLIGIMACLLHEVLRPGLCPLWTRIVLFGLVLLGVWMPTAPPQSHNHHTRPSERVSVPYRGVDRY
jgi:hypothetical protein